MATWQQAGNSGALLAGLGGMNSNAPRASDADATLAYIRQNNEMERSGRNNVGLQALQGISSVMDMAADGSAEATARVSAGLC